MLRHAGSPDHSMRALAGVILCHLWLWPHGKLHISLVEQTMLVACTRQCSRGAHCEQGY